MPEWNLVRTVASRQSFQFGIVICLICSAQIGCSKIQPSSLRSLLEESPDVSAWRQETDEGNLEDLFQQDPSGFESFDAERAVASGNAEYADEHWGADQYLGNQSSQSGRLGQANPSGQASQQSSTPALGTDPIRLTAIALASSSAAATNPAESVHGSEATCEIACNNPACNHNKTHTEPKLPFAAQVEPPVAVNATPPRKTELKEATQPQVNAPPMGVVSQPLTPILFNGDTREVTTNTSSLRTIEEWELEKSDVRGVKQKLDAVQSQQSKSTQLDGLSSPMESGQSKIRKTKLERVAFHESAPVTTSVQEDLSRSRRRSGRQPIIAPMIDEKQNDVAQAKMVAPLVDPNLAPVKAQLSVQSEVVDPASVQSEPIVEQLNVADSGFVATESMETPKVEPFVAVEEASSLESEFVAANTSPLSLPEEPIDLESDYAPFADCPLDDDSINDKAMTEFEVDSNDFAGQTADSSVTQDFQTSPQSIVPPAVGAEHLPEQKVVRLEDLTEEEFAAQYNFDFETDLPVEPQSKPACESCGSDECGGCPPRKIASPIKSQMSPDDNSFAPASHSEPEIKKSTNFEPAMNNSTDVLPASAEPATFSEPTATVPKSFKPETFTPATIEPKTLNVEPAQPVTWQKQISQTIDLVQQKLQEEADPLEVNKHKVNLRLLQILERNMKAVEEDGSSLTDVERQYWENQLGAIATLLQTDNKTEVAVRATSSETSPATEEGLAYLRRAVEQMEAIAGLRLTSPSFCTEVNGFGQVTRFPTTQFAPSQRVLLYCEVENYKSAEMRTADGSKFVTRLRGNFVIIDKKGTEVQKGDFPIVEDVASKKRRDFYMYFPIGFNNLPAGQYKLGLLVEDLTADTQTMLQPLMSFSVK